MKIKVIQTGSDGNCVWINHKDTNVLIDAGFKSKTKMQECLEEIMQEVTFDGIVITHEHTDHFNKWTGRLAMEKNIPIYLHEKHLIGEEDRKEKRLSYIDRRKSEEYKANIVLIKENEEFTIKDLTFYPFTSYHDAHKTLGFRINENTLYLTDCGFISNAIKKEAMKCNNFIIELNHDEEMLMNSDRHCSNKLRTLSKFGHLSNSEAIKFFNYMKEKGVDVKNIITLHISRANNTHDIIEKNLKHLVTTNCYVSDRENNNEIIFD